MGRQRTGKVRGARQSPVAATRRPTLWDNFRQGGRYHKHLKYGLILVAVGYMVTRVIAVLGPEDDFKQQLRLKDAVANAFEADAEKEAGARCSADLDGRMRSISAESSDANRQPIRQYADDFMNKACKRGVAWSN